MITSDMLNVEVKEERKTNSYHISCNKKEKEGYVPDKLFHIYFSKHLEIHEIIYEKDDTKMTTRIFPFAGIDYATFKLTSKQRYNSIYTKNVVLQLYKNGQEIYLLQFHIENKQFAEEEYSNTVDKELYNMFYSFSDDLEKKLYFFNKNHLGSQYSE